MSPNRNAFRSSWLIGFALFALLVAQTHVRRTEAKPATDPLATAADAISFADPQQQQPARSTDPPSIYANARDMLSSVGKRVQEAGSVVRDSVVTGYNYSVDRIGAAIRGVQDSLGGQKSPPVAAGTVGGELMVAAAATNMLTAFALKPVSQTLAAVGNQDQIVFQNDYDDSASLSSSSSSTTTTTTSTSTEPATSPTTTAATTKTTTASSAESTVSFEDRIIIDVPVECPKGTLKAKNGTCRKLY